MVTRKTIIKREDKQQRAMNERTKNRQTGELTGFPSVDKPWRKYYTKEQLEKPLTHCSVFDYIEKYNKSFPADTALNYFDRKISYKELFERIESVSKSFKAIGIKEGDIVPIISVTLPEIVYSFYGLNRIGAISNMIDPRTSISGICDYILEVNAKVVVVIDAAYKRVVEATKNTNVKCIISVSPADSLRFPKKQLYKVAKGIKVKEDDLTWRDFLSKGINEPCINFECDSKACATIVHTGGTTGMPKGVMLSNDNLNAAADQALNSPLPLRRNDVFLNVMPPFIAYGVVLGIHTALAGGWEQVVIPVFDANAFDKIILKYKPAAAMGVPTHFDKVIASKKLERKDLSHIKCLLVGGDKIKPEFEEVINEYLNSHGANIHISKGYSMTEASSTATFSFEECNKVGSVGIPLPKTTIAVFDEETDEEKGYNEIGILHIQSPTMMQGYYAKPEETKLVIKTKADGSKWIYTGDYGYIDEDGVIFVEGRSKRMLIRHDGFKVFPTFIEKTVEKIKSVQNCCVVGKQDSDHSQGVVPVVYITLKESALKDVDESKIKESILQECIRELPEYAQPSQIEIIDELPLTPIGKVDFKALEKACMIEQK